MKPCYLDLFSGAGRVAKALRRAGQPAEELDILLSAEHDVTRKSVLDGLLRRVRLRLVRAALIAAPCTTFSRARRCPTAGRPGPLRSSELPWGLPRSAMSEKDQARLDNGNAIMRATLTFLQCCVRCKVPFILENPQSSIMWWLPEIIELAAVPQAQFVVTHFCQWGTPWKKATKFLCYRCPTAEANLNRLCHARGCICSRTQQPHVVLSGANKGGILWTRLAQPYPTPLAKALGRTLEST